MATIATDGAADQSDQSPGSFIRAPTSVIDYLIWPSMWVLAALTIIGLTRGGLSSLAAIAIAMLVVRISIIAMEWAHPRHAEVSVFKDRYSIGDILYSLSGSLADKYVVQFITFIFISHYLVRAHWVWPTTWPLVVQLTLFQTIFSFCQYWEHRLAHTIPLMWRLHAIHHSPTLMHHLKKDRHTFLELGSFYIICVLPLLLIGAPLEFFLWITIWESVNSMLKHSNIKIKVPVVVECFMQSADLHHLHHSIDMREGNSNYGTAPIWDRLFRTFSPPTNARIVYGLPGNPVPHGFIASNLFPFSAAAAFRANDDHCEV